MKNNPMTTYINPEIVMRKAVTIALLAILCLWTSTTGWSQTFNFKPPTESSVIKTAKQIKDHNGFNDTIIVRHDKWNEMAGSGGSWGNNLKFKSVHAFVKFYVNHAYPVKIHDPYTFRLTYTIYGYGNMADTNAYSFFNDTLTISYKPDSLAAFTDLQYKKYSNFHKIMVVLTGLYKINDATSPPVLMDLSTAGGFSLLNFNIEGSILIQPFHKRVFSGSSYVNVYGSGANLSIGADAAANDYLPVRWNLPGSSLTANLELTPVKYELEWLYVDNYKVNPATGDVTTIPPTSLSYNFKNNSTRIWLDTNYYRIPLTYQKGHLIYRVRMVRPDSTLYQYPVYGPWTIGDNGIVSNTGIGSKYEITQAHLNDSTNWQYTISFAEQGKFKHVMSYYDGMLKNRQSITRFNSLSNKLIATEQVYDYEGRPSISVLPTPIASPSFHYQYNLTLNAATGLPYRATDFDQLQVDICPMDAVPSRLADGSPAQMYYSPSNPDQAGFQKFVPDAGGYPFVQTVYSAGYDERIEKQGGAGDSLQIGFNHNVKNDYVSSDQMDLNRLFGVDIGWSGYYRKTVSRDPNGQLSLNVTDYRGKTVTSSMIGIPDTTLHAIVPNENLPDTSFYYEDHIAGTTQQIIGNKRILDKNFFNDAGGNNLAQYFGTFTPYPTFCPGKYLSVAARYDYTIFDECGTIKLDTGGTIGVTNVVYSPAPIADSSEQIPFFMEKGKHSLHKELKINTDDVVAAVDKFLSMRPEENCLKTEPWFIKQSVLEREFPCPEGPDMDCGTCEGKKYQMMQELWPNKDNVYTVRKYGIYTRVNDSVMGNGNSIFTVMADTIPSGNPEIPPTIIPHGYRYQDTCLVHLPASVTKFGHTYTNLQNLPVDTFIYIFNDSIAEALLPLHPEYCELLQCADDNYAGKLRSIPDATIAQQLSLHRLNQMIAADPVYAKMLTMPAQFPNPIDSLSHFAGAAHINLDTVALMQAYCGCNDSMMFANCYSNYSTYINNGTILNSFVAQRYFETIRNLYIGNRTRFLYLLSPVGVNGDCATCQDVRMTLVPPPVFTTFNNPGGGLATGPGSFLGQVQNVNPAAANTLTTYFNLLQSVDLDTLQAANDSAYQVYTSYDSTLCAVPVDQIIAQLVNCADSITLIGVRNYLLNLCQTGQVHGGYYTPQQIRAAILSAGISLNDLCNPYLINYDNNLSYSASLGQGPFMCNSDAYYSDLSATLNHPSISMSLKNPGVLFNVTLDPGNLFQQQIINTLGVPFCSAFTTYNAAQHLYTLQFRGNLDTVSVFFKTADNGACATAFNEPAGTTIAISADCINNAYPGLASGYIGQFTFTTTVTRTTGGNVSQCVLPAWSDNVTINLIGDNPIAKCVPCTQMRTLYKQLWDTLTTYNVKAVGHPYYTTMLRNFMNYRLKKAFTTDQYTDFIESCALTDSMRVNAYVGYYFLTFSSTAFCDGFLSALNSFDPNVNVTIAYRYQSPAGQQIAVNLTEVPKNKLKTCISFMDAYTTGVTSRSFNGVDVTPHFFGHLWVPTSSSFVPGSFIFNNEPNSFTFTLHTSTFNFWYPNSLVPYKLYLVNGPVSNNYADDAYNIYRLRNYLQNNNMPPLYFSTCMAAINNQYLLPEKKSYLNNVYSFQNLPVNKVLDSIQAQFLTQDVPLFNGKILSYGHPAAPGNINNLYVADPVNATNNTLYGKLQFIIDRVRIGLTGNALFFTGNNTRNISIPAPGEMLTAYRCRDTAFWYRYFGAGDTLYNVFIRIPQYIDTTYFSGYQFQSMTFNPGEENSYSFKVTLQNPNAPVPVITLNGFTDFVVAKNLVLRDVLLTHAVNEPIPVADTVNNCERQLLNAAIYEGKVKYQIYIDSVRNRLTSDFMAYIMNTGIQEKLYVGYRNQRFNYTLYYYDRAGNLARTVPPAGVATLGNNMLTDVDVARTSNSTNPAYFPAHTKPSDYKYNSLNQVVEQETPDGGRTEFFYDAAGRVIFSQNAKQRETGRMAYTLYDKQGRIIETGQAKIACTPYFPPYPSPAGVGNNPCAYYVAGIVTPFPPQVYDLKSYNHEDVITYVRSLNREEVVLTQYDKPAINLAAQTGMSLQENLRKRVSSIKYFDLLPPSDTGFAYYNYAMHFSYDIAGNVKTLTRDYPAWKINSQQFKRVDYDYDVISGKVNMLSYNRGFPDQYFQRYNYDSDNRIVEVKTSADGYIWKRDAEYKYYQHGPLARMSVGDLRVQGVDFAYTIQGWLKAVNGDMLDTAKDMGNDAFGSNVHANDAVALSLDYFKGDYRPIGSTPVTNIVAPTKNMYNGNIPRATTNIAPFPSLNTNYVYDQLNRIVKAQYAYVNPYNGQLNNTADYYSKYAYDHDGNLTKLVRNGNAVGSASQMMDSLEYIYPNGNMNNRLQNIADYVNNPSFHTDIQHYTNTASSRYLYDATGNTIKDLVSGQDTIKWNHYNKVDEARKDSIGNGLYFAYDGAGNRYLKTVTKTNGDTTLERSDYYVRDAQGNILAVYDAEDEYKMTKTEWIEYLTVQYATQYTYPWIIDKIFGTYFAQVAQFKSSFLAQVFQHDDYVNQSIDAWPVSFYVSHSEAVKSNILAHAGSYPDFYSEMKTYSQNNGATILGSALYNRYYKDAKGNRSFLSSLLDETIDPQMRKYVLDLMCSQADSLFELSMQAIGITPDTSGCAVNTQLTMDVLMSHPERIQDFAADMAKTVNKGIYEEGYWNFIKTLSLDNTVLNYAPYTSTIGSGALIPFFQEALNTQSNPVALGGFLDSWAQARSLLKSTNAASNLVQIAYDNDAGAFLNSYVTYTGSMTSLYQSLHNIPWLTGPYFIDKLNKIDTIGTITHTIWENVLKSRRIALDEHHLYGSSRLGTKEYLSGQHYIKWDYTTNPITADTITLLNRRPWYSLEYNDDISGLNATSPYGLTDVSAFQAGHVVGQKQYELTNHLGNVQATVSDLPVVREAGIGDTIRLHYPALITAYDYYPFGMLMPGRGTDSILGASNSQGNILVIANDFSDGTTQGWQPYNALSSGSAQITNDNGKLKITCGDRYEGTVKQFTTIPGRLYRIKLDIDKGNLSTLVQFSVLNESPASPGGWNTMINNLVGTANGYTAVFTSPTANMKVQLESDGNNPAGYYQWSIDNFILEEIKPQPEVPPATNGGCITTTQSKWVTTWETKCYTVSNWVWPYYEVSGGSGTISSGLVQINASGSGRWVSFKFDAVPQVQQSLELDIMELTTSGGSVQIAEEIDGNWVALATGSVSKVGKLKLNFTPTKPQIKVTFLGPLILKVKTLCITIPVLKQENVLVTVCPDDKDKYRFGFNGQEKVNEWAGIGNYLDFGERGYDPRIGRFLSIDKLTFDFPANSPYLFADNNPILFIDENGDGPKPLTTAQFIKVAKELGVTGNKRVGELFERLSIAVVQTSHYVIANSKINFYSPARAKMNAVSGKPISVRPDGIKYQLEFSATNKGGQVSISPHWFEAKATTALITKKYRSGQIMGMIDAVAQQAKNNPDPLKHASLTLLTTADTRISEEIKEYAASKNVTLWRSTIGQDEKGQIFLSDPVWENRKYSEGLDQGIYLLDRIFDSDDWDTYKSVNPEDYTKGISNTNNGGTNENGDVTTTPCNTGCDPDPAYVDDK